MAARNLKQCVRTEYPKFIDQDGKQVLVLTEEQEMNLEDSAEKTMMIEKLKAMGKEVDGRKHRGPEGFVTLKLYYEGVMSREGDDNGDGS